MRVAYLRKNLKLPMRRGYQTHINIDLFESAGPPTRSDSGSRAEAAGAAIDVVVGTVPLLSKMRVAESIRSPPSPVHESGTCDGDTIRTILSMCRLLGSTEIYARYLD